jgi:uncharacterized protein (DUF2252 family)
MGILESQDRSRVPELVPIRYGRMVVSPLAFFRGAAAVMASDLARSTTAGLPVQLSGDAHLSNFGGFASPERDLVFDLNDFDETLAGPFEWDVKRLATSLEIAGRDRDFAAKERTACVLGAVRWYRQALRRFAAMGDLDVWYARLDARTIAGRLKKGHDQKLLRTLRQSEAKAYEHDQMLALAKLTRTVDGEPRFVSNPPLILPLRELEHGHDESSLLYALFSRYRHTLPPQLRTLVDRFHYVDLARRVVGVGSVGTRCWVTLLLGRDGQDPLFLQIKEAQASVLEPLLSRSPFASHGQRVVEGQRLMQAAGDIFLGWVQSDTGLADGGRDFYLRQLWDWKASIDPRAILPRGLADYAAACGWTLARAHARSGDRIAIAAYLGSSDRFDRAVTEFAAAYADLNASDHANLVQAIADGRVNALAGA